MAEELETRSNRIRIHDSVRDIYDKLHGTNNLEQLPFPQIKDVFVFAACIGLQKNKRKEFPSGKRTDLRLDVFSDSDKQILKAIALASTNDITVLEIKNGEKLSAKVLTIVEEYAHGGIQELKTMLETQHGHTLYNLVDFITNIDADNISI